jgi:glutamine phosphoribosylpyrophosphate amidotransferase
LEEAWAADLGVDSLTFLSMDRMNKMFAPERRCAACFDGIYPLPVPADQRRAIVRDRLCGRGG